MQKQQPRLTRAILGLPKQKTSENAFTRLCAPLIGKRVCATHKAHFLVVGVLEAADDGVLRIVDVEITSRDRMLEKIPNLVININVISHIHEAV